MRMMMSDIKLKPIEWDDMELLRHWRNNDKVLKYCREYRLLTKDDQNDWYSNYLKSRHTSDWDQELYILYYKDDPIGVGGFTRIEWKNRKAELSFYIGEDKQRIHGVIEQCIYTLIYDMGFHSFNFHKIIWPVYGHDLYLDLYKRLFDKSIVLEEEYWWHGKFQDRHYLYIFNHEEIQTDHRI